eukprot:jgi/Chrpa1/22371/Chrysochromulina_OHIO_Genome00022146-RA
MFAGQMKDLLVWDVALSPAELDAVRLGVGLPSTTAPLISMMRTWCPSPPPTPPPPSPPPPSAPPRVDVWWMAGNGCDGANEHGQFSGRTLSACAAQCLALTTCISFEFKAASGTTTNCQLSSSCDTQRAGYNPIQADWWLFIRGSIYNTLALNYNMISTGGCNGANELGVYDVTDTLATYVHLL